MRFYTKHEQESILQAARRTINERRSSGSTEEIVADGDSHGVINDPPSSENREILQLLVDLESESKFVSLMRMIQRRLRWL